MKKVIIGLFSIFTVLFFISCGSKPAPKEQELEAPVVEEQEVENEEQETPEIEETEQEDLSSLIEKIDEARNAAVEAGADTKAADLLNAIDDLYAKLKEDGLSDNADFLVEMYNLLVKYVQAKDIKTEIDDNNLAGYAQKNYDSGVSDLQKIEEAIKNGTINAAVKNNADDAVSNFNTVITVAYKRMAKDQRDIAYKAKVDADSVKAGVSQKERYKEAADDFKNADALYSMQSPKKALEKYTSAAQKFAELYEEVYEKRAAAQAAIEAAKKKVQESAQYAESADDKAPISEKIEGIEDDDTVLLEEDDYENPEDAEADIAETIDDEIGEETEESDRVLIESESEDESDDETFAVETQAETETEDETESEDEIKTDDFVDESEIIEETVLDDVEEE